MKITSKDKARLTKILDRMGYITTMTSKGFFADAGELRELTLVPFLSVAFNPPMHEQILIRTPHDHSELSDEDKRVVEKAFGYTDDDYVIWFSQKNVVKVLLLSRIQAISFYDDNGNKMYFAYAGLLNTKNQLELSAEDGEPRISDC